MKKSFSLTIWPKKWSGKTRGSHRAPDQRSHSEHKDAADFKTRVPEYNQKQLLGENQIVTTRLPIIDEGGRLLGALCVFKDITDAVELAEEVTNLKQVRTMLEAIIQSSDEAISVVDENGIGLLINKAYTKMTGLSEKKSSASLQTLISLKAKACI